jgi:hypothetical protein
LYAFRAAYIPALIRLPLLLSYFEQIDFIFTCTIRQMKISLALLFASIVATSAQDNLKERLLEHRADQFRDNNVRWKHKKLCEVSRDANNNVFSSHLPFRIAFPGEASIH